MNELRTIFGRIATYLELYTVFGVLMAIAVFVFFSVSGAISAAQAARTAEELSQIPVDITMPMIFNFLVLPLLGITIIIVIHVIQPKNPVKFVQPYITLYTSIPISIAVFVMLLIVLGGAELLQGRIGVKQVVALTASSLGALLSISIPVWISYHREIKLHKGLVRATADFLRDLSEVRKTGLSPEKCIVLLSSRDYRNLTPIITRVATALSIGLPLEDALRKAFRGIKEWFTLTSFRFLVDSITVGGGSPEVIDTLARFTQVLSELEEETRRRMRSQLFLPYFGSILLSSIPIIILNSLLSIARISLAQVAPLVMVLSLGSLLNSFIMGLIAGKVSESTILAGFKHAALLSTVSATASLIVLTILS